MITGTITDHSACLTRRLETNMIKIITVVVENNKEQGNKQSFAVRADSGKGHRDKLKRRTNKQGNDMSDMLIGGRKE